MDVLAFIGTCIAIALLAACDVYLAVTLWRERSREIKNLLLGMETL